MTSFDSWMNRRQTKWRADHVVSQERGIQNGRRRRWILPLDAWEEGLWPGIGREASCSLVAYLERNQMRRHSGAHNLKSSWVLCANLYFVFGASPEGQQLFASFLKQYVSPEINSLDRLELEYAESGNLNPARLLGEEGGSRGVNQTSPDMGLLVNDGRGLVLVENKLTEHSFYKCSAWKHRGSNMRPGNPDPDRCNNAVRVAGDHCNQCNQTAWGRRYWEHLAPIVDLDRFADLPYCPASRHGSQLFRQQALAEAIARSGKYELVVSAVAMDERNTSLDGAMRRSGVGGLRNWGRLFGGMARFSVFTHQQWVAWVSEHDRADQWKDWLQYVESRYGLGE